MWCVCERVVYSTEGRTETFSSGSRVIGGEERLTRRNTRAVVVRVTDDEES